MATTTPNFGWAVPTSTDLVKDGALAIETLGDSIDASLVDLKGGTTGQVLAKATGTDMDFTWTTAGGGGSSNVAGKNGVLNSAFNVWQRGTSISLSASSSAVYTSDRWCISTNANQACTVSRQTTSDTTNLPFIQYAARVQRNSGQTGTGIIYFAQTFETINSIPFFGKTVTVSFYARAGANYSPTSNTLSGFIVSGTTTDGNVLGSFAGQTTVATTAAILTTTWQRFTMSGTVGSSVSQLAVYFANTPIGTAGANDYYEVTGVQVEIAAAASAFSPNTSTYQAELAACQRYYFRQSGSSSEVYAAGSASSTTMHDANVMLKTTMRITPTVLEYANLSNTDGAVATAITSVTIIAGESTPNAVRIDAASASGLTQFRPYYVYGNGSASYVAFSAEL